MENTKKAKKPLSATAGGKVVAGALSAAQILVPVAGGAAIAYTLSGCDIFGLGNEDPYEAEPKKEEPKQPGEQQEVARQQGPQTIDISGGNHSANTTVTGFMTDSQWAAAVPKLKNAIVGGPIPSIQVMGIFTGTPPPLVISKIVLEKNPEYPKYNYAKTSKEISFNVDYLINTNQNTLNNELSNILYECLEQMLSKVDARDTVRMAKAPVNGKAFAARDTRWYWLGYFLLET